MPGVHFPVIVTLTVASYRRQRTCTNEEVPAISKAFLCKLEIRDHPGKMAPLGVCSPSQGPARQPLRKGKRLSSPRGRTPTAGAGWAERGCVCPSAPDWLSLYPDRRASLGCPAPKFPTDQVRCWPLYQLYFNSVHDSFSVVL